MKAWLKSDSVRAALWWLPGCLIFFRPAFTTGFDRILGDDGDSRLAVFTHEHWVQVAKGNVSWTSPEVFWPTKGVLGYTDTYFLNQVFYFPLRGLGFDQFLAFQWTLVLLSLVGFVALFVFLRRTLDLAVPICAALATTFAFANSLFNVAGHTQLYAVYWLPVLLLILLQASRATERRARIVWGGAAGALLGLLFYSSYYIAWFASVAAIGFTVIVLVWRVATRGFAVVRQSLRAHVAAACGATVGFGLAMIPFVITYLPAARLFPDRSYKEAMSYAAWPSDIINLGRENYLWGSILRGTLSNDRLLFGEVWMAVTPVLMLSALIGCAAIVVRRRSVAVGFTGEACVAATVTLACLTVLPMKFGTRSLWAIAYEFIPGSRAIRAIDRVAIVCGLIAVLIVAMAIRLLRNQTRAATAVLAVLLSVIVIEQLNFSNSSRGDRSEQLRSLIIAPAPPAECRAFYIVDSGPRLAHFWIPTIDAMQIAQHFELPTINGYSGQFPPGYDFLDTAAEGYIDRVHVWADAHGVREGLCAYDRTTYVWTVPDSAAADSAVP